MITIKRAFNGYILESTEEDPTAPQLPTLYAENIAENNEEAQAEVLVNLLYGVLDELGYTPSRYAKARVYIEIRPGDKYE